MAVVASVKAGTRLLGDEAKGTTREIKDRHR